MFRQIPHIYFSPFTTFITLHAKYVIFIRPMLENTSEREDPHWKYDIRTMFLGLPT